MAFSSSFADALSLGYDAATPKQDKNNKTAYQRYIEKFYGPGVTSHTDPVALARAATGAVERGLKTGAGYLGHAAGSAASAVGSAVQDTRRAVSDIGYNIRDKTSSKGFVPGMQPMFDAMRQAAADAGLSRLEVVAGKGQGHLSHAHGTEADIVGYNADGSKWSKAQRVAVAKGASTAGANRFGLYSGPTLHVGLGYQGSPHNVVWNNKLRGVPGVNSFAPEERDFVNALRAGKLASYRVPSASTTAAISGDPQVAQLQQSLKAAGANIDVDGVMGPQTRKAMTQYPDTASAYTSTSATTTPAIQAATQQADGQNGSRASGESGTISRRGADVASMQRDLNSRGAKLTVDGLEGPLTRAASQQFYGSPTSVRTPSFTSTPPTTSNNWSSLQGSPTRTVNQRQDYVPTGSRAYVPQPSSYTSGRGDEGTAVPSQLSMNTRNMRVPTQTILASQVAPVGPNPTAFNRPAIQTPPIYQPHDMGPYFNSTGGANAIVQPAQTARIPQHRPDQAPSQQEAVPTNGITIAGLTQLLEDHGVPVHQIGSVISDIGARAADAARSGGMGQSFSGAQNSGLGYAGGRGFGGGSISRGTGGAINPNR